MYYSLRITTEDDLKKDLNQLMININAQTYLFAIEFGKVRPEDDHGKRHYQGAITTTTKEQTIRKAFKKMFPKIKGNQSYSLKKRYTLKYNNQGYKCDEGIYAYCAKDSKELKPGFVTNLTKKQYIGYNLAYYDKKTTYLKIKDDTAKERELKREGQYQDAVKYLCSGNYSLDKKPIFPKYLDFKEELTEFYVTSEKHQYNKSTFKYILIKIYKKYQQDLLRELIKKENEYL